MVEKFLTQITPYIQHYLALDLSAVGMLRHMRDIALFIKNIRAGSGVIIDVWYFTGDNRKDITLTFDDFAGLWVWLMSNYLSLQGAGFDVLWADGGHIFDGLWANDLPNPQSESPSPLNDFLINEIIKESMLCPKQRILT